MSQAKTNSQEEDLGLEMLGFVGQPKLLELNKLLPSRKEPAAVRTSKKFQQLMSSMQAVGLIEPLSVAPADASGVHVLLDGHLRWIAAQLLNWTEIAVLVANDDEGYTYNTRINRLSTIQETHMLRRAVERGVSPQRLAEALSVDVTQIQKKVTLLDGLCREVIELLKDVVFTTATGAALKKMKPTRQIECVELMLSANNFTQSYAEAMLAATPSDLLVDGAKTMKRLGVGKDQMLKMENEMASLQRQYKLVEQTYGQDVLDLVLAKGYLSKLLGNAGIEKYLQRHHPEILKEFKGITSSQTLEV